VVVQFSHVSANAESRNSFDGRRHTVEATFISLTTHFQSPNN
jgi:hypothetical protein